MDEFALSYEYLIRRAFRCGRFGVAGANADEYRRLERKNIQLKENKGKVNVEDIFEFGFECGQISAYIKSAIDKFVKDFGEELNSKEKLKLDEINVSLIHGKLPEIQKAIKDAEKIMIDHNLFK